MSRWGRPPAAAGSAAPASSSSQPRSPSAAPPRSCAPAATSKDSLTAGEMTPIDEAHVSVRFKHGIHTVFLFVDALAPFAAASPQLRDVLRERYPSGLTTSLDPPTRTTIPADAKFVFGVLNSPAHPAKGWRKLDLGDSEERNATECGVGPNSVVAFALAEDDGRHVEFQVQWPRFDDDDDGGAAARP